MVLGFSRSCAQVINRVVHNFWGFVDNLWTVVDKFCITLFLQDFFFFPKSRTDSLAIGAAPSKTHSSRRSSSNMASIGSRKAIAS